MDRSTRSRTSHISSGRPQSAEWTPASVSGLFGWWRADASDITIATGVSAWVDRVNGHALTQATGANQPSFSASDANFNDHGSITFDGSNDYLMSSESAATWDFLHAGSSALYMVLRRTAAQTGYMVSTGVTISNTESYFYGLAATSGGNSRHYIARNTAGTYYVGGVEKAGFITTNTTHRISQRVVLDTSVKVESDILAEASVSTSGSQASGTAASPLVLGMGGTGWGVFHNGPIAAMLVYNAVVSDSDHALICDYLDTYYGI